MKKIFSVIFICFVVCAITSAAANQHYKLKFDDFNELSVVDDINVDYVCDPSKAGLVEFDAPNELVSAIIFEPSKTKLSIKLSSSDSTYRNLPTVTVYSSYLTNLKNDGDSLVRVQSIANGPKFTCRVMGNGRIEANSVNVNEVNVTVIAGKGTVSINGECKVANLNVTGAGKIDASGLKSLEVSCSASHGTIECNAVELLSVGGVSGKVFYRGEPKVKKRFISHVKLTQISQESSSEVTQ